MLYNYSESTYRFAKGVEKLAMVIGVVVMALLFVGVVVPAGKLSVLNMTVVCQIVYFSLLQFDQVPLTIEGFGFLSYSNGFNDLGSQN